MTVPAPAGLPQGSLNEPEIASQPSVKFSVANEPTV